MLFVSLTFVTASRFVEATVAGREAVVAHTIGQDRPRNCIADHGMRGRLSSAANWCRGHRKPLNQPAAYLKSQRPSDVNS